MAIIKAFKGIRPTPELAGKVASRPYDVMNSAEARIEADGNPYCFLHVTKPEIDLPVDIDPYAQVVYDKAKENLQRFIKEGTLNQDAKDNLYVYRQIWKGKEQTGIVAASSIDDYFNDVIKKHEFTRPAKEKDRISHMRTMRAQVGPVFLTYPANESIDDLVNLITARKPEYDFEADDEVRHILWVVQVKEECDQIVQLFRDQVPYTYIADGHHRAASSAKVGKELRDANEQHSGKEEYNYFLSVLFPDNQLRIIDYNRLVKDLNGMDEASFLSAVSQKFEVEKLGSEIFKPGKLHEFGMYLKGKGFKLTAKAGTYNDGDPIGVLDITVLSNNLLDPILGIKDQRTDDRIDFVGGIRGMKELEKRVNSGEMAVAFAIYAVTIQQLIDIADSGNVMPPKSTWFEPKLRSGLIIHEI